MKKEDSLEISINYEQQRAKDYLTQQTRNSENSSITKKHDCIQTFLQGLTPTEFLWKATKKIKQVKKPPPLRTSQGTRARSNIKKGTAKILRNQQQSTSSLVKFLKNFVCTDNPHIEARKAS
jgi:hypothetical protein